MNYSGFVFTGTTSVAEFDQSFELFTMFRLHWQINSYFVLTM